MRKFTPQDFKIGEFYKTRFRKNQMQYFCPTSVELVEDNRINISASWTYNFVDLEKVFYFCLDLDYRTFDLMSEDEKAELL